MARAEKDTAHIPRYVISVASRLVGVPPHTLRSYEQADLIAPARTEGNMRLYSDADIHILRRIVELSDQGVNLAGIKIILEMEGLISGNGADT
ncbi:MAG: MerR family transcriptional regulator [Anaerolineae bacterium]